MVLRVLGSSSAGNCYILDNGKEALVLECGVSLSKVKEAVGYDISRIAGAFVSHEHNDHCGHAGEFISARIPVFMSEGTAMEKQFSGRGVNIIRSLTKVSAGGFSVLPFDVRHDAAEPMGFLIRHDETGDILFATDTYYIKYRFRGLSTMMIECNYDRGIVNENTESWKLHPSVRNRIIRSHMSLDTCIDTILANDRSRMMRIVLIHLSSGNMDAREAVRRVYEASGIETLAAVPDMKININRTPF